MQIVLWGTERMPQRIQRLRRVTLHRSTHPQRKQEKTWAEKSSYSLGRLQKRMWYGPAKLDNKLPQNIQNIRWSHKLYRETMKSWKVELIAGGRILAEAKVQRGIFQGNALSPLLFIIVMMPLNHIFRKCTAGYKLNKSHEKIYQLIHMDDIKLFAKKKKKWKRTGNSNTCSQNIQSGYRNGI